MNEGGVNDPVRLSSALGEALWIREVSPPYRDFLGFALGRASVASGEPEDIAARVIEVFDNDLANEPCGPQ